MDSQVLHLDRLTDLDYHYAGLVMGAVLLSDTCNLELTTTQSTHFCFISLNPKGKGDSWIFQQTLGISSNQNVASYFRHMYHSFILLATIPAVAYAALSTYMKKPPYDFNSAQMGLMSLPRSLELPSGALLEDA
ncbi:Transcriptional activator of proteases prtT [Fusarium oxysporum f. sp. albedinis]|nr:PXMP2/4 family protein 3 [Fusarium oxysporum f. sp. albedinis]KAJ0138093.1 Transcriptional activator of proteases prtT [Fusarium oxysporum f. sp. albedinis]